MSFCSMQIFSTLPHISSRGSHTHTRGFTIVELVVSISIVTMITTFVFVRYTVFDSTVLLKGVAYDIALLLRESQIKSISAQRSVGGNASFDFPFGITFKPNSKLYTVFQYASGSPLSLPRYDRDEAIPDEDADPDPGAVNGTDYASVVQANVIGRTMLVSDICVSEGNTETCSSGGLQRLDVSFRRPEYRAIFFGKTASGQLSSTVTSARIKVGTPSGANSFIVEISGFGQISVRPG